MAGPGWSADNKWELERGWITTGATLDELAANIAASKWDDKMDAEKLKASVARWNELCDKGADEDFGRSSWQRSRPVRSTPFRCTRASAIPSAVLAATRTPTSSIRAATRFRACTPPARSAT